MKEYETVFVLHPNLEDSRIEEEIEGIRQTIAAGAGEVVDVERWGRRKFAYPIQKYNEGIYTLVRFRSEPPVISELERRYRLREDILRHLTVLSQGPYPEPLHRREATATRAGAGLGDGGREEGGFREGEDSGTTGIRGRGPELTHATDVDSGAAAPEEDKRESAY